ncbi:MAG: ABC transporter permease subunit, partial [Actinomycetota bacterium]|nr:ABC transporter permease subunit [Actinomycetota bacterium]
MLGGLRRIGLGFDYGFMDQRAGFAIREGIDYSPNDTYARAFIVGLVNTLRVAVTGIILASVLGLFAGIARLSTNWLVRRIATVYVEVFRNTPLLVQLFFWYVGVFLQLPPIQQTVDFFGLAFLSVRGTAVPWVARLPGFRLWLLVLVLAVALAWLARRTLVRRSEASGQPIHVFLWSAAVFLAVAAAGYLLTGAPAQITLPLREGRIYSGGAVISPELTALLVGLVVYTGSFIAEVVRGSILAVSRGQSEAALALGLSNAQRLRLVVIPQALRIMIPPLANQYLNLTKNTSLAFAVAWPDLFQVSKTIISQGGGAVSIIALAMLTYLAMSLAISAVANFINARLGYPTR